MTNFTTQGSQPFEKTAQAFGARFHERRYAQSLVRGGEDTRFNLDALHAAMRDEFVFAWGGRPSACTDDPELCPSLEELSAYAARFALEFAALGASIAETVRMTLDLHNALDREYHLAEEPADLSELHFAAVHHDRLAA